MAATRSSASSPTSATIAARPSAAAGRRDATVIGLIGSAHGLSHFFQLALPPLFPLMREELGVGYAALGLVMSVFYGVSGLAQTPAGFLVDRLGPRRVLVGGLGLVAGAVGLTGLAPAYGVLLPLAALAGLGNSVFHPADYSLLTAKVSEGRLGRAYSVHALAGNIGWALAPVVVLGLTARWGWRAALLTVGGLGLAAALALSRPAVLREGPAAGVETAPSRGPVSTGARVLASVAILACFAYFALLAFAGIGVQTFLVSALMSLYGMPVAVATGALTTYLVGGATGIVVGGRLADLTRRHDLLAGAGMGLAALLMASLATGRLATPVLLGVVAAIGFASGATSPSRDMLIRRATPRGASGRVFGFVYSGLDLGSSTGPLLFGALLDQGAPRALFLTIAATLALTIATVVEVGRRGRAPAVA